MTIRTLILISVIMSCGQTLAKVDDAPLEYDPKEKLEWISSFCKWRMPDYSRLSGYVSGPMNQTLCHAIGRFSAIRMTYDTDLNKISRYKNAEFKVIYDDHKGYKESCRIIPLKNSYDEITHKEFSEAYLGNDQRFEEFIKRLDANIKLICSKF